jgi:hypothetical protein
MVNWNGCGRRRSWPNLRYCVSIYLDGLMKTTNTFSQDSRSPGQDLNLGPLDYEARLLITQ